MAQLIKVNRAKGYILLCLSFITWTVNAQNAVDSLVALGIQLHDNQQYSEAIDIYKEALKINSNSSLVNYEISMTYMYNGDYEKSLVHSQKVIDNNQDYIMEAFITKGSCLDYLGETKQSIKLFKKGIKRFGDHYLFYYNLGYNYSKDKNYKKAEESLIKAIKSNPTHASSHLMLAYLMNDQHLRVQSLLCLHYFLLLEPASERSESALTLLNKLFTGNVYKAADRPNEISINIDPNAVKSEYGAADLMISMLEASKSLEENEHKSNEELFIENTTSFFKVLGELKDKKHTGLWWDFYVPFYTTLAQSNHMATYCYYIQYGANESARAWLEYNAEHIDAFEEWLNK